MKCVRFWGTRGSLPVALTAAAVRSKVVAALRGAAGRSFASDADLERYVDDLDIAVSGTYGWTINVTIPQVAGGTYRLFVVANDPLYGLQVAEGSKANNTNSVLVMRTPAACRVLKSNRRWSSWAPGA